MAAVGAATVALLAGPAAAHVEVKADKPQAGATDVTVSFSAEAESTSAGVVSVRVVLPDGIPPSDVTYVSGPAGWTFTPAADGYTVGGPALPKKTNVEYSIKIAKLPTTATSLPFKTLQTYEGGRVDRWIEIPQAGQQEPDNPAPVLKLAPAAAPASPTASAAAPSPSTVTSAATSTSTSTAAPADSSSSTGLIVALVVLGLAVIVVVAVLIRRRGRGPTPS